MEKFIYYVTTDRNNVHFNLNDYASLNLSGIKDLSLKESERPLSLFREKLSGMGAVTQADNIDYTDHRFPFTFCFPVSAEKMKYQYFRPKFEQFLAEASQLTVMRVMEKAPEFDHIFTSTDTDRVTLVEGSSETTMLFDDFIRRLEQGVTYYVYKRVVKFE